VPWFIVPVSSEREPCFVDSIVDVGFLQQMMLAAVATMVMAASMATTPLTPLG
jgi:hypothetical protein